MTTRDVESSSQSDLIRPDSLHWVVHDHEIQEHDSRIGALERTISELTRTQTIPTAFHLGGKSWISSDQEAISSLQSMLETRELFNTIPLQLRANTSAYLDYLYTQGSSINVSTTEPPANKNATVALWAILQYGSALMALTATASLALWLFGQSALLNPFVSMLTLVSSPFVFLMGVAAKRN